MYQSLFHSFLISIQRVPDIGVTKLNKTRSPFKQEHDGPTEERRRVMFHCDMCNRCNQGYEQSAVERQGGSD